MDFDFFCSHCFHRFAENTLESQSYDNFNFFACRKCGSDAYRLMKVDKVILLVDSALEERYVTWENWVYVNWLQLKEPIDYDEIEIRSDEGSNPDIEELVMILNNDMDEERRERMVEIPVKLGPGVSLSQAKTNLLSNAFLPMPG